MEDGSASQQFASNGYSGTGFSCEEPKNQNTAQKKRKILATGSRPDAPPWEKVECGARGLLCSRERVCAGDLRTIAELSQREKYKKKTLSCQRKSKQNTRQPSHASSQKTKKTKDTGPDRKGQPRSWAKEKQRGFSHVVCLSTSLRA